MDRKQTEDFLKLSKQMLRYGNLGMAALPFLRKISKTLLEFSSCDAMELRLRDIDGRPYLWKAIKTQDIKFQHILSKQKKHTIFQEENIHSKRIQLYKKILQNATAGKGKSYCISFSGENASVEIENCSITIVKEKPYRFLALFPFAIENYTHALLILKSKKQYAPKMEQIRNYQEVANILGDAISARRSQTALRERIKELRCLYHIDDIVSQNNENAQESFHKIVKLLPPGWQYPNITHARIIYDNIVYKTEHFCEGKYKQSSDIVIQGEKHGVIEVFYTEARDLFADTPFLTEEQKLLDSISSKLAVIIERSNAKEEKQKLQNQLLHADRLATIGQLAAGVAHELNEPLSNILGFAQLAKKCASLPEQAFNDLEKIESASLFSREVVKKLLIFARGMPSIKTKVNLNTIIENGFYFESRCARQGVTLSYELEKKLPFITGDSSQLTQVLVNLVVNAFQAMPKGGKLTIITSSSWKTVSLYVKDTGLGMSEEVKKNIFIPFFTTKNVEQGTGLGLAVVHGIIKSHDANIEVESKEGEGTTFGIHFPIPENA